MCQVVSLLLLLGAPGKKMKRIKKATICQVVSLLLSLGAPGKKNKNKKRTICQGVSLLLSPGAFGNKQNFSRVLYVVTLYSKGQGTRPSFCFCDIFFLSVDVKGSSENKATARALIFVFCFTYV
jgi:hypothetical protein